MPIDIIYNALNTFGPLGNLRSTPVGATAEQNWINSKYDIVFGDTTSWILGFGRTTGVFGSDLKLVIDWTDLFNYIPVISKYPNTSTFLLGQGGSTDLILGPKNLFNYGSADFTYMRKKNKTTEVKLVGDDWPNYALLAMISVAIFTLVGLNVGARVVFMTPTPWATSNTIRKRVQSSLQFSSSTILPRFYALLVIYERFSKSVRDVKNEAAKIKESIKSVSKELKEAMSELPNQAVIVGKSPHGSKVLLAELNNDKNQLKRISADVVSSVDDILVSVSEAVGIQLNGRSVEESNTKMKTSFSSYQLDSAGTIAFNVLDDKKSPILKLILSEDGSLISESDGPTTINSEKQVTIKSPEHLTLKINDTLNDEARIELLKNGGSDERLIHLACGSPLFGSSISMAEKTIKLQNGITKIDTYIEIDNSSVTVCGGPELVSAGTMKATATDIKIEAGLPALRPSITINSAGILLSVGPLCSIKMDPKSIEFKVAENKLELDIITLLEQAVTIKTQSNLISEMKTTIEKMETTISSLKKTVENLSQ